MTIVTSIGGVDMRGILARCCRTIVTAGTASRHSAVIKHDRGPAVGAVAIIADIRAGDVIGRFTERRGPIMTAGACAVHR